ncbi:MAG: HAMP domain-containing sensor histidine kinase, partial [Candidatus Krumholzibacteria bacterium]|nr:HAMP domain-containing sensor histidine kinase [Candidatus Krumholzibacteria bacterium]
DFTSDRNAKSGQPIRDMQFIINLMGNLLWEVVSRESSPETLSGNLARLIMLLSKGKDAISGIYMRQRNQALEELRKANLRLMELGKRKLDLLAKVSHELKTPLTSVIAYSEQLRGDLPKDVRAEFTEVVYDQSHKLLALIEDLMDYSRSEDQQSRLNLQRSDLKSVIEEAVSTVQSRAQEKGVQLVIDNVTGVPEIRMDSFRIQQVIWNLLTNGVKYNREGGEVLISARRRGDEIIVSVRDTGIGIALEDQERIFSRFHRSHDPMAQMETGAGLGLDLARHYVNLHGGNICVESLPGKGSTFSFTLPLEGPPEVQEEEKGKSPSHQKVG